MTQYDTLYCEELQGRMRGLLIQVAPWLTTRQVALISDLIDANESGIALEMMSDVLQEIDAPVDQIMADEAVELAEQMQLKSSVAKLRAQIR